MTENSKSTPGPWHLVESSSGKELAIHATYSLDPLRVMGVPLVIGSRAVKFVPPRHGVHRGETMRYGHFSATDRANARLIAASPTMYDYVQKRADAGDVEAVAILEGIHASR